MSLNLRGTPRWEMAIEDADLESIQAASTFSSILKSPITMQNTPELYKLLRLIAADAGNSTCKAKEKYLRHRPFLMNNKPICTPDDEDFLKGNGSYPSGHAAIGWAWALALAEIAPPGQTEAILARGWAFGESRVVCNVHWESDVTAGRLMGAAVIKRLHDNRSFRDDIKAAQKELADMRAREGLKAKRDDKTEAKASVH